MFFMAFDRLSDLVFLLLSGFASAPVLLFAPSAPSGKNLRPVTGGLLNQTSEVCSSGALYCPNVLENALELVVCKHLAILPSFKTQALNF